MGVRKRFHNTTLGAGLALALIEGIRVATAKKGVLYGEMSWILEDNDALNRPLQSLGAKEYRRWRVYDRAIDA